MSLPRHLSESGRVPTPKRNPEASRVVFATAHDIALCKLAVPLWQRENLLGIADYESKRFSSPAAQAGGPCGLKAKVDVARKYAEQHNGAPLPFIEDVGHADKGDPDRVFYFVSAVLEWYWAIWIPRHVGTPEKPPYAKLYRKCWAPFWAQDPKWIDELVVGYAGSKTPDGKKTPAEVIASANARRKAVEQIRALMAAQRIVNV